MGLDKDLNNSDANSKKSRRFPFGALSRGGPGMLNSAPRTVSSIEANSFPAYHRPQIRSFQPNGNNYENRRRTQHSSHGFHKKRFDTFDNDSFSLKQRIDESNEITVRFQYLTKEILPHLDISKWILRFSNLTSANKWSYTQVYSTMEILCDEDLIPERNEIAGIQNLISSLEKNCFPQARFLELEHRLKRLRSDYFQNLRQFYKTFNLYFDQTNFCLDDNEKMSERDRKTYFIRALNK